MKTTWFVMGALCALGVASAFGCSSDEATDGGGTGAVAGTSGSAGAGGMSGAGGVAGGDAGAAGSAGAGGASTCGPLEESYTLPTSIEIAGTWYDNEWSGVFTVTPTEWSQDYGDVRRIYISQVDDAVGYFVGRNEDCTWSRIDWVLEGSGETQSLHYCQIEYAAATEGQALANEDADRSSLTGGCSGFAWSLLEASQK
jgi:hypothetical protein